MLRHPETAPDVALLTPAERGRGKRRARSQLMSPAPFRNVIYEAAKKESGKKRKRNIAEVAHESRPRKEVLQALKAGSASHLSAGKEE